MPDQATVYLGVTLSRRGIALWLRQAKVNVVAVNPYEVTIAIAFFLLGIALLVVVPDPQTIASLFPMGLRILWGALVALGGTLKLLGLLLAYIPLRMAGALLISGMSLVFVIAIIAAGNPAFVFTGGIFLAIALSSLEIFRRLRRNLL